MSKTYSEKLSRSMLVLVAVSHTVAALAAFAMRSWSGGDGGWLASGFVLVAFSASLLLGARSWMSLDDMERYGQSASWFWGSMLGLAATACLIAATGMAKSEFTVGVATLLVAQVICSLLLYMVRSLRGRNFGLRTGK